MNEGLFIGDQRKHVLDFIKSIDRNFEVKYSLPDLQYSCPLTSKLNHSSQYDFESTKFQKDPNAILSADQLRVLFDKQLRHEIQGFLEVSI